MLFHSTIFSSKYKEEYTIQTYMWDFGVQKIIYVLITTYRDHTIQDRIYESRFHRRLSSFLDYRSETKNIFCKSFSPIILTLRKILKEIYNIVGSHLFIRAIFRILWRKNFLRHFLRVHYFWVVL